MPVIANGDILTEADAALALARSGADGVMVGRGCYGRPWFLGQVMRFLATGTRLPDPPLARQAEIVIGHYRAMREHYGEEPGLRLARKHLGWYSRGLPGAAEFRATVMRLSEAAAVEALVERFFTAAIAAGGARGAPSLPEEAELAA
jgi:tRNA-dihydrouridine synthase B